MTSEEIVRQGLQVDLESSNAKMGGSSFAAADSLQTVLVRVVHFVASVVHLRLEDDDLVLRASKNPHADIVD